MPQVQTTLEYLRRLPLYDTEKPYWCFLRPHAGFDPNLQRVDNLEFEDRTNISIKDIRESNKEFSLDNNGFQVISHQSRFSKFEHPNDVVEYRAETEQLLKDTLGAVYVKCYDSILRKNATFQRDYLDLADLLHIEGPARGVHNGEYMSIKAENLKPVIADITSGSMPDIINTFLPDEAIALYLKPGFRIRIVK